VTWTFQRKLVAAALVGWTLITVINLVLGPPLGHDEAAFALVARGDAYWVYRSRGVVALGELGLWLGGADWQLRLPCAVVGLAMVPAVYALGRALFDARSGAWAAAVIAGAHPMLTRNADLLGDVPAAAGVIAGMAVLAGELTRADGPRRRLVLAAPAFAAAFYLRYGSSPVIALAGVAALALWWRRIVARPLPVLATAAAFVVLMVPHALHSIQHTGHVLGVLRAASGVPRRLYWGEGIVTYLTSDPFVYYGALVTPVVLAALVGVVRGLRGRGVWFVVVVAVGQLLALGIESHGQPRYVFVAVGLLVVLGVEAWRRLVAPRPRLALAAVGLAWLGVAIGSVPYNLAMTRARASILAAAAAVRADHAAHAPAVPCLVFSLVVPQLRWYTSCEGVPEYLVGADDLAVPRARYAIKTPYGGIDGNVFALSHGFTSVVVQTGNPRAQVWALHDSH
jgi:4-amino-4-deoxy-L-arabinose transferase-like glycosyltransferase